MKGRSFDTFQVDPGNQEAYTVCRRVALLEEMGPALIVLLGPEGCGKSHLLWAIAKQVRVGTIPVGLALLAPDDIPDKVRGLVEDSRPLEGRRAILLVDGLEHFDTEVRRLDAIIETFLACQHPVIVTTSVHPNRLGRLSVPLVNRLSSAQYIAMEARVPDGDVEGADRLRALEEAARDLQRQRDDLQLQVDGLQGDLEVAHAATEEAESRVLTLQQQVDEAAKYVATLTDDLNTAVAEKAAAESRLIALQQEAAEAQLRWQQEASGLEEVRVAKAAAEARIATFREEADYALAQQARLQGQLGASRRDSEEAGGTRAALARAEASIADAVKVLGEMRDQHAALCRDLETDLKDMVEGLDETVQVVEEERSTGGQLRAALSEANRDQQQIRASLTATRSRLKTIEFEWAKTRKVLAIQTAEMDALRYAAAGQVALANIEAGELEKRISLMESALDALRATRPEGGVSDEKAGKTWSMALENMQAQLLALRNARSESREASLHEDQATFGEEFFEALPAGFEGDYTPSAASPPLPGIDGALKEALRGALGAPSEESIDFNDGNGA